MVRKLLAASCLLLAACTADVGSGSLDATEVEGLGPFPQGEATHYPIVLAHGFDASPQNRWGFNGVAEALRADGHQVFVANVPPYESVEMRAAYLAFEVDEARSAFGAAKVNLVAHSMGGLDARYLVGAYGYGEVVASVTTISTPHRGSNVADVLLRVLDGLEVDDELLDGLASAWGLTFSELAERSDVRAALRDISEGYSATLNGEMRDDERVYYQSWAGVSSVAGIKNPKDVPACGGVVLGDYEAADHMNATLVPMASAVAHGWKILPNDGMVTVASAEWGSFRGCIPADHLDEVGWKKSGPDGDTRFDHLRFYRNVAFELAAFGF